jgi:hypothetical protein
MRCAYSVLLFVLGIPVHAVVWLFGSALAGLGWLRLKHLICIVSFFGLLPQAHAELISYKIEGDLTATKVTASDFSVLDGAHFERIITFDVSAEPLLIYSFESSSNVFKDFHYRSVSDELRLTNRPDGFADKFIDLTNAPLANNSSGGDVYIVDRLESSFGESMQFQRKTTSSVGEYPGLDNELEIGFVRLDWNGQDRFDSTTDGNQLLPAVLNYDSLNTASWFSHVSGQTYAPSNVSISMVPIPAALWLFGSALAGLGWMRRKTA